MRFTRILLIVIAVACFAVALSYPIRYRMAQDSNNSNMDELAAMRARVREEETQTAERPDGSGDGSVPVKILLTAFEPFGGEAVNAALEAVKRVEAPEGVELTKLTLPTVFSLAGERVGGRPFFFFVFENPPQHPFLPGLHTGGWRGRV